MGVIGLVIIVSLPILIASSFEREAERFELCQRHLRYDCDPSIMWVLRGFTNAMDRGTTTSATSTMPMATSTGMVTDPLQLFASSSTASSTPLLLKFQSNDLVRNGSTYRAQAGASVKLTLETKDTETATIQVGTETSKKTVLKRVSPGVFQGTVKLPKTLPVTLEFILRNGDDIWTGYRLSVASNQ